MNTCCPEVYIAPQTLGCARLLYFYPNATAGDEWLLLTSNILFFAFPAILAIAVIFSLINCMVTAKMAVDSHECYVTGFSIASTVMLLAATALHLPNYVPLEDTVYTKILPYLPAVENWCWYTCTWLLLTAVIEKAGYSLCASWHESFGRIHGILVSTLLVVVCFVSTLPQYWEYSSAFLSRTGQERNCTEMVLMPRENVLRVDSYDYVTEYEWYHWYLIGFNIVAPYLLMPILLPPICCVRMLVYTTTVGPNSSSVKYTIGTNMKERLKDERSFNRLLCAMTFFYLTLAAPRNALHLMLRLPLRGLICDNQMMMGTLWTLFNSLFYAFFIIVFFLYLAFSSKFKVTLYRLSCCKKHELLDDHSY